MAKTMPRLPQTAWAVMRQDDTHARGIFPKEDDATAYAQNLNEALIAEAPLFHVYPWNVPEDTFED